MGCVCGKPSSVIEDDEGSPKQRELLRKTSELRMARAISTKSDDSLRMKENLESGGIRIGLTEKKVNGSRKVRDDYYEKKNEISRVLSKVPSVRNVPKDTTDVMGKVPFVGNIPKAVEGEQIAAGWPSWLVAFAGEAISGWLPRKADTFEKLEKIGQGTYSSVYKGRDLLHNKLVALKKVRFDDTDPESVKFMAREICILRNLDHPNVIKLEGLVTSRTSSSLYLVFEYMEHDLTGLLSLPGVNFTEEQVKCFMQQLLSGLDYCHDHGVLHRDIKGSNLLIDNHGILKIADFGLACCLDNRQSAAQLTSRVVTLWYRPPELLLGATQYGVSVDLWSTGCILGELCAGKPIMPGRTEVEQLHKIFKLCGSPSEDYWRKSKLPHSTVFKPVQPYRRRIVETFKDIPDTALRLMETLLSVDPSGRGTAASALKSEFFATKPFACDTSSLPKFPPSKEIDAKQREEEARRHGGNGAKIQRGANESKRWKEQRAAPAPDANSELPRSMQMRQGHPRSKSRSELFNYREIEDASGFPIDPPKLAPDVMELSNDLRNPPERYSHSGPLGPGVGWMYSGRKTDDISTVSTRSDLAALSGLSASRPLSSAEPRDKLVSSRGEGVIQIGRLSESFGEPTRKHDRKLHSNIFNGAQRLVNGRASMKEPFMDGHDSRERKIHFSGPILAPSNNIEHVLREHDHRVQEVARRLRHEKAKAGRNRPQ